MPAMAKQTNLQMLRQTAPLISYEELVRQPEHTLARVSALLGLASPIPHSSLRSDRSTAYRDRWKAMGRSRNPVTRSTHA